MSTWEVKDPTLHGTNALLLDNTLCNTVNIGAGTREWKDDTIDASFNTTVSRSSEQAYLGDYSVKLVCLNVGACKATFSTYGFGTAGEEYEFACKVMLPTRVPSEPLVLQLMAGNTLGASDLGLSGTMIGQTQPRGEWLQAPTCKFLANGSTVYLTWAMYANDVADYLYVDNFTVRPKKLDWTKDN